MTPKEKAIELYNKFRNENPVMSANIRAKKQSLILVDEIIEEVRDYCDDNFHQDRLTYWNKVKNELIKLK